MAPEFISNGGLLRDLTVEELLDYDTRGGTVWGALDSHNQVLAGFTVLPFQGMNGIWHYFNYGIVRPALRHRGGRVIGSLIETALRALPREQGCFVISVAHSIFLAQGFEKVTPEDVEAIDPIIARVIRDKLRPNHLATILVRSPKRKELR